MHEKAKKKKKKENSNCKKYGMVRIQVKVVQ